MICIRSECPHRVSISLSIRSRSSLLINVSSVMDRPIIQRSIGHRHSQFRRAQQHEITRIHRPIFDRDPRQDSTLHPERFSLTGEESLLYYSTHPRVENRCEKNRNFLPLRFASLRLKDSSGVLGQRAQRVSLIGLIREAISKREARHTKTGGDAQVRG